MSVPAVNMVHPDSNSLLNCLGMQPIFVERNQYGVTQIPLIDIFCVERQQNKKIPMGKMKLFTRRTRNNIDVLHKSIYDSQSDNAVINVLLRNSSQYRSNIPLSDIKHLKEQILYHGHLLKLKNAMMKANFLISSNEKLLNELRFKFTELKLTKYLVDEKDLPKNILIMGLRELNTFLNPICACPLFDKELWNKWIQFNNLSHIISSRHYDMTSQLPIVNKYVDVYELYQHFINQNKVEKWYIHEFTEATTSNFYTTLIFDKL